MGAALGAASGADLSGALGAASGANLGASPGAALGDGSTVISEAHPQFLVCFCLYAILFPLPESISLSIENNSRMITSG